jgi:hypothetical protein
MFLPSQFLSQQNSPLDQEDTLLQNPEYVRSVQHTSSPLLDFKILLAAISNIQQI